MLQVEVTAHANLMLGSQCAMSLEPPHVGQHRIGPLYLLNEVHCGELFIVTSPQALEKIYCVQLSFTQTHCIISVHK